MITPLLTNLIIVIAIPQLLLYPTIKRILRAFYKFNPQNLWTLNLQVHISSRQILAISNKKLFPRLNLKTSIFCKVRILKMKRETKVIEK